MNAVVTSPLSGSICKMVAEIPSSQIISLYHQDVGIDVTHYFSGIESVSIYACPDSGYRFYYPTSLAGDPDFYAQLENDVAYYSEWKWENEQALSFLKENDRLLDVGCGDGAFCGNAAGKKKITFEGIDTNAQAISEATRKWGDHFYVHTIGEWKKDHLKSYDVITCFQVLEHITEPIVFLNELLDCLKKDGLLIIAVPNNRPYLYGDDMLHTLNLPPHHSGLWNLEALEYLQTKLPLQLVRSAIQPIGEQLNYYEMIRMDRLKNKHSVYKSAFGKKLILPFYSKMLRLNKNKIEGHTIMVVFRKKG